MASLNLDVMLLDGLFGTLQSLGFVLSKSLLCFLSSISRAKVHSTQQEGEVKKVQRNLQPVMFGAKPVLLSGH
ncbi:hypothetical protein V6N13_110405 [Hibiscus sabdariffa]|uniref:Uncharacterized protein n=1 Tax=Hibiscus sabdariffa TaxID=183260 RepID=A0ABR2TH61_9ROSI